jgi:hypothetical protein
MNVVFSGSKFWVDEEAIKRSLDTLVPTRDTIFVGGAKEGVDAITVKLAKKRGFKVESFPPNGAKEDLDGEEVKGDDRVAVTADATETRNKSTTVLSNIDFIFAFPLPSARKTHALIRLARDVNVPVKYDPLNGQRPGMPKAW